MEASELVPWIENLYGKVTVQHANGVFVAAVSVMGGVCIGCGSGPTSAVYDLYCDLCLPSARLLVSGVQRQPWETERRDRIDATRS